MTEITKPTALQSRGGCWFEQGAVQIHLGVWQDFTPASKAHPGLLVSDLGTLAERLNAAGFAFAYDTTVSGRQRGHVFDPFGNRLEFIQDGDGFTQRPEATS